MYINTISHLQPYVRKSISSHHVGLQGPEVLVLVLKLPHQLFVVLPFLLAYVLMTEGVSVSHGQTISIADLTQTTRTHATTRT